MMKCPKCKRFTLEQTNDSIYLVCNSCGSVYVDNEGIHEVSEGYSELLDEYEDGYYQWN